MIRSATGPSRRDALLGAAALASGALVARSDPAAGEDEPELLRVPDLSDDAVLRSLTGLRPYRRGGIRLEREPLGAKTLVHAYGHGGAGVTLSWGTAEEVTRLLADVDAATPVAVVGSGAVGLATARVLQERGHRVNVYARDFPPRTTSNVAGAHWLPFGVDHGDSEEERARHARILLRSWQRFDALAGDEWSVVRMPTYEALRERSDWGVPPGTIAPPRELARLPFPGRERSGRRYDTFLIEPPAYLPALLRAVLVAGAKLEARTFGALGELADLPEPCVVNCTGLGARELCGDEALQPVRGHLVHVFPQRLGYSLTHPGGYLFARRDALVLGGTWEPGLTDTAPDPAIVAAILAGHRAFFAD